MQEKYYIDIDSSRKILGRYLLSMHGENIPNTAQEVTEEVFNTSIQGNHNYLSEELTTESREVRTEEEIMLEEIEATERAALLEAEEDAKFLDRLNKWGYYNYVRCNIFKSFNNLCSSYYSKE